MRSEGDWVAGAAHWGAFQMRWSAWEWLGPAMGAGEGLATGDDEADSAYDEVAGGAERFDFDQLDGEIEPMGSKDEPVGFKRDVAKEEGVALAEGVDVGLDGAELGDRGVVAVEDDDVVGGEHGLHGQGLCRGDADGDEALHVAATDELPGAEIGEAAGGELNAVERGGRRDEGVVDGAGRGYEWNEVRRGCGGGDLRWHQQIFDADRKSCQDSVHGCHAEVALAV